MEGGGSTGDTQCGKAGAVRRKCSVTTRVTECVCVCVFLLCVCVFVFLLRAGRLCVCTCDEGVSGQRSETGHTWADEWATLTTHTGFLLMTSLPGVGPPHPAPLPSRPPRHGPHLAWTPEVFQRCCLFSADYSISPPPQPLLVSENIFLCDSQSTISRLTKLRTSICQQRVGGRGGV